MINKLLILAIFVIPGNALVKAQNQLPADLVNKIPAKYKLVNGYVIKQDEIVNVTIGLEMPSKYGCGSTKENYTKTSIGINIALNNNEYGEMMEQVMPFSSLWPNKETHKANPSGFGNEFTTFSETKTFGMPGGQAAYYTWTRQCIQDANKEVRGVSLMSVSGSHSKKMTIGVDGDIDGEEAISVLKEMHMIVSQYNFYD